MTQAEYLKAHEENKQRAWFDYIAAIDDERDSPTLANARRISAAWARYTLLAGLGE